MTNRPNTLIFNCKVDLVIAQMGLQLNATRNVKALRARQYRVLKD
jgi:hypothetical protein